MSGPPSAPACHRCGKVDDLEPLGFGLGVLAREISNETGEPTGNTAVFHASCWEDQDEAQRSRPEGHPFPWERVAAEA
jgi:hypothetical protein